MLAIGYVMKGAKPGAETTRRSGWLSDPEAFRAITESINLFLQAVGPSEHPAVWADLRRAVDEQDFWSAPGNAGIVASEIGRSPNEESVELWPLIFIIHSWLGEDALKRLRDRMPPAPESE
jgi:hypothetical protein